MGPSAAEALARRSGVMGFDVGGVGDHNVLCWLLSHHYIAPTGFGLLTSSGAGY